MDWQSVEDWLKIVVGAGAGTAIVQAATAYFTERRSTKAKADFLALQIAVVLENFAKRCALLDQENQYAYHRPDEEFPEWSATLPTIDDYPDDVDGWRSLDQNLVGRCLNLRSAREEAQKGLIEALEYAEDEAEEYVALAAAEVGLAALNLATEVRTRYGLLASQSNIGDSEHRLERRAAWAEQELTEARERSARLMAKIKSS